MLYYCSYRYLVIHTGPQLYEGDLDDLSFIENFRNESLARQEKSTLNFAESYRPHPMLLTTGY